MEDRRKKRFWKTRFTFWFLILAILFIFAFSLWGFLAFLETNVALKDSLGYPFQWLKEFIIFTASIIGAIITVLVSMYILLCRSLGPQLRMEKVLEQVLSGNYSARLKIREKDAIHSLADKLNQVLDLFEKANKG